MSARGKVLLIGGAGYIGSVLTGRLLAQGRAVRCLDLLIYQNRAAVAPYLDNKNYELIVGDLADGPTLAFALEGVSEVVLLAGLVGDPITRKYPEASRAVNEHGLSRCIDTVRERRIDRLVFVSTCSNYGLMPDGVLADETSDLKPLSSYAESKVMLEKKILSLERGGDLCPVILRFATAFGLSGRMRFDLTVSEFTQTLFLGRELVVYDADTWRPYCHVSDFSRLIQAALEAPAGDVAFEVFNAGGDMNNFTKKRIVDEILKRLPEGRVVFKTQGQDRRNYRVSFEKVRRAMAFEPQFTVAQGIDELIAALRQGRFSDHETHRNFYGNHEIRYPVDRTEAVLAKQRG